MGPYAQNRISFRGNSPLQDIPQGASRNLLGNLHYFDGFGTDKFAIEELIGEITDAIHHCKLLHESANADRSAAHDPIVREVTECNCLATGFNAGHILGNAYLVTEDGIVGVVPDIIAVGILESAESKCGFIVHQPYAVFAVFGFDREEQLDYVIVSKSLGGHTDLGTTIVCKDACRHIHAGAADETIIFRFAEILGKALDQVVLDFEERIADEGVPPV